MIMTTTEMFSDVKIEKYTLRGISFFFLSEERNFLFSFPLCFQMKVSIFLRAFMFRQFSHYIVSYTIKCHSICLRLTG